MTTDLQVLPALQAHQESQEPLESLVCTRASLLCSNYRDHGVKHILAFCP